MASIFCQQYECQGPETPEIIGATLLAGRWATDWCAVMERHQCWRVRLAAVCTGGVGGPLGGGLVRCSGAAPVLAIGARSGVHWWCRRAAGRRNGAGPYRHFQDPSNDRHPTSGNRGPSSESQGPSIGPVRAPSDP